jgi:decaprenyl-phosphate phosphoribosyltransferase
MRVDHWFKNVFVLPGIVVALSAQDSVAWGPLAGRVALGLVAVCLVASSNYVINEVLDAPSDLHHPEKRTRPVPSGLVDVRLAVVQWLVLMVAGVGLGALVGRWEAVALLGLWVAGCVYNIRPLRTKDLPYLDILTEAVNNPIRMLVGWFMVAAAPVPPLSLLVSYWMIGCYFMGLKRFAEYRDMVDDRDAHVRYRRSFAHYDDRRLLVSVMFYGSAAMLFFGAFVIRYRIELILAFPLIAVIMAIYLHLAFEPSSPVEHPEKLYRQTGLMVAVVACAALMLVLLFVDLPWLGDFFPRGIRLA